MRGITRSAAQKRGLAQQEQRRGAEFNTTSTFSYFTFQENVWGFTPNRAEQAFKTTLDIFQAVCSVTKHRRPGLTD